VTRFDLALIGLVLIGGLWGMVRGALRQVADAVAWIACFALPWKFGGVVAHALEEVVGAPYAIVYVITCFALGLVAQVVVRVAFMLIRTSLLKPKASDQKTKKEGAAKPATNELRVGIDRSMGSLLGSVKLATILWVALSILALADAPLERRGVNLGVNDSGFVQLSTEHNAIAMIFGPEIHHLDKALRKMQAEHGRHHPAVDALSKDPRWQSISHDDSLSRALMSGDVRALKRSPVISLLTDAKAMEKAAAAASSELTGDAPQAASKP
jgi:uncharacterized membrane protein required for colicin V production